jgi:(R,R)-butanediol dehydrogenase/meso-butanediol dehydrogenase/diacetyl reductase
MEDGALIEPLACGLHGVHMAAIPPGARVLVIGAGAIGLGAAFWAKRMGAGRVAVMARTDRRADIGLALGADKFLSGADAPNNVPAALGGVPDVVLECSGAVGTFAEAINLVRPRGTIVEFGFCTKPDTFVPAAALAKEVTVKFSFLYSLRDYEVVADTFDAGHVEPRQLITETVGMDALPAALESLRGPNDQCKVMVDPWS